MKIKAIVPWFGSKRTLAPHIVAALGDHDSYWEPFAGSMAVLLAKPTSRQETVCDLHGDLTNLAWVLQDDDASLRLFARAERTLMNEPLFLRSQRVIQSAPPANEPDAERAYHYLVTSWMGRNGMAGTQRDDSQIAVRWTSGGGSPAGRWRAVVGSLPSWCERLRNVLILRRDAFEVLAKIEDEPGTAIYADPPYLYSTRKAKVHTARGGGKYVHDFGDADHERLAALLRRFIRARVVVSYYADPRLAELYPDWQQQRHDRKKNLSLQQSRGAVAQRTTEVLLVNRPPAGWGGMAVDLFARMES